MAEHQIPDNEEEKVTFRQHLEEFVNRSNRLWAGSTRNQTQIKGSLFGIDYKAAFGHGNAASVTYIAFLKECNVVSNGIYPVILYNSKAASQTDNLEVCYGVSAGSPDNSWMYSEKAPTLKGSRVEKYRDSKVLASYRIDKNPDVEFKISDEVYEGIYANMRQIIKDYYVELSEDNAAGDEGAPPAPETVRKAAPALQKGMCLNQILYGPPGTGKTYHTLIEAVRILDPVAYGEYVRGRHADARGSYARLQERLNALKAAGRLDFVSFHQSFSYEDFVEGIRPVLTGASASAEDGGRSLSYRLQDGIFKKIANRAARATAPCVLIIDEINRGNISRILGELITLLEDDKRGVLHVRLPYSQQEFTVPRNLCIIGTMNTADKSIASIDVALRRRFKFREMMPKTELVPDFECSFRQKFALLNLRISALLNRDHQIGHSFFMKSEEHTIEALRDIWFAEIIPLLNEYFYGDWDKLQALLGKAKGDGTSFIRTVAMPSFGVSNYMADEQFAFALRDDFSGAEGNENFIAAMNHAFP